MKNIKLLFVGILDNIALFLSDILMGICNLCLHLNDLLGYSVEIDYSSPPQIPEYPDMEVFEIYGDFYDIVRQIQFVCELDSPNEAVLIALKEWQRNRFVSSIKGEE